MDNKVKNIWDDSSVQAHVRVELTANTLRLATNILTEVANNSKSLTSFEQEHLQKMLDNLSEINFSLVGRL